MRWQIEAGRCPRCHSMNLVGRVLALSPFVYCGDCRSAWPQVMPATVLIGPDGMVIVRTPPRSAEPDERIPGARIDRITPALGRLQKSGDVIVVRDDDGSLEVVE